MKSHLKCVTACIILTIVGVGLVITGVASPQWFVSRNNKTTVIGLWNRCDQISVFEINEKKCHHRKVFQFDDIGQGNFITLLNYILHGYWYGFT